MRTKRPLTICILTLVLGIFCAMLTNAQSIVEGRFVWVNNLEEFTEGDYLILSEKSGQVQALDNVITKGSNKGTTISIEEEAVINASTSIVWELRKTEHGFSLKNLAEKKYLTQSDAHKTRSLAFTSSPAYFRHVDFNAGAAIWRSNQAFKNDFRWNPNDGSFANFDDGTLYQPVYLFKREGSEPTEEPAPNPPSPTPNPTPTPPADNPNRITITMGASGYATFFSSKSVAIPQGLNAFVGTISERNTLVLIPLNKAIPANTAVVLKGEKKQVFSMDVLKENPTLSLQNDLRGSHEEIPYATILANTAQSYYALANLNGVIGFHRVNRSIPPGKAYLLLKHETATQGLTFSFEMEQPTNLTPSPTVNNHSPIYDLYGRRVWQLRSGQLYLQNGKKYLHP